MAFWALALLATFTAGGLVAPEHGLRGAYYTTTTWNGPVRLERVDETLNPELLVEPPLGSWQAYSIDWTGVIRVPAAGTYTFATISDDGSEVEVDGQPVVDNRGFHEARKATGAIALAAGFHEFRVRYQQLGGRFVLHLLWAPGEATLRPIPAEVLWPQRPSALAALEPWASVLLGLTVFAVWCVIYLKARRGLSAMAETRAATSIDWAWQALRRPSVGLAVALGIGGVVRLALLASSPAVLWPDSHVFYLTVRDILGGRYFAHDPYRTLLYPYYLSLFLAWGKTPFTGSLAILGQQVIGLIAGALFYWVGRRAFSPLVALAGTALFLCHSLELFYEISVMTEVLFTIGLAAVLWLAQWHLDTPSLRRALVLGVACGTLVLIRPVAQWFVLCVAFVIWMPRPSWRATGLAIAVVVTSFALAVPIMFANQRDFGFFGISLGRGMGLYTRVFEVDGLEPPDPSVNSEMHRLWAVAEDLRWSPNRVRDELNFGHGRPSTVADDMMFAFAVETVKAHPVAFAWRSVQQWAVQLWAPNESVHTCLGLHDAYLCSGRTEGEALPPFPNEPGPDPSPLRVAVVRAMTGGRVPMPAVIGAAAIGLLALLARARTTPPGAVLAVLTIAYFTLVPAVTQVPQDRYRLPVDALLFMLAAWGVRGLAAQACRLDQNVRTRSCSAPSSGR